MRECAEATKEPAYVNAVATAEIADYTAAADDQKLPLLSRIIALDNLYTKYPAAFKGREDQYGRLQKQANAAALALEKQGSAAEAARKRKEGVTIGMSREDVLASSWGKPKTINSSHYSWGTTEQWVYGGGYLYFKNGILESVQN